MAYYYQTIFPTLGGPLKAVLSERALHALVPLESWPQESRRWSSYTMSPRQPAARRVVIEQIVQAPPLPPKRKDWPLGIAAMVDQISAVIAGFGLVPLEPLSLSTDVVTTTLRREEEAKLRQLLKLPLGYPACGELANLTASDLGPVLTPAELIKLYASMPPLIYDMLLPPFYYQVLETLHLLKLQQLLSYGDLGLLAVELFGTAASQAQQQAPKPEAKATPQTTPQTASHTASTPPARPLLSPPVSMLKLSMIKQRLVAGQPPLLAQEQQSARYARAVGTALHHNPIILMVPCHAVVPVSHPDGGNFSWNPTTKKALITHCGLKPLCRV